METNNQPTSNSLLSDLDVPHLDQYFGVWAMKEDVLRQAAQHVNHMDLRAHVAAANAKSLSGNYLVQDGGIAQISVRGTMMKFSSSLSASTSTVEVRKQIRAAANDPDIRGILLVGDSPGGTVAGTKELGDEIAKAAAKKPVYTFIEDLGASAFYWVASQSTKVYSNETALVGSIGVFSTIHDYSKQAEQLGVKVHVIKAGKHKGSGVPGTEVTEEQLAEWQAIVDTYYEHFVNTVAAGRSMSVAQARQLADGRVHIGIAAHELGLTDGVRTYDEVLAELRAGNGSRRVQAANAQKGNPMSKTDTTDTPAAGPADVKELRAACPKADEKFLLAQLERKATLQEAQQNYIQHLEATNDALSAENATLKSEKEEQEKAAKEAEAKNAKGRAGVDSLGNGKPKAAGDDDSDPVSAWNAAVQKNVDKGMTRDKAAIEANRQNPGLREEMLAAANAG